MILISKVKTMRKTKTGAERSGKPYGRIRAAESLQPDEHAISRIRSLVAGGEGHHLEFKAKANHPEKIARSLCSFANASGGTLLLGVSDSGVLQGVRYPEEDISAILDVLHKSWPKFRLQISMVALNRQRWIVRFDVREGRKKPVALVQDKGQVWYRLADQSLQAGPVKTEILRRQTSAAGTVISFGAAEKSLLGHLGGGYALSLSELIIRSGLQRNELIGKLAALVSVGVLRLSAESGEERFSLISPA